VQQLNAVHISGSQSVDASRDTSTPIGATRGNAHGKRSGGEKTGNPIPPPIETHWSRILYYDLFGEHTGADATGLGDLAQSDLQSAPSEEHS
jgi:hypothetical protein